MDVEEVLDKNYLIKYFITLLIITFITFFSLEILWTDDPFQKVVLAPLGEEPLKLLIASFLICVLYWSATFRPNKNLVFNIFFLKFFVFYSIIAGLFFGSFEGYMGNIFLHISISSIGVVLILFSYQKVKNRKWKDRYKLTIMFVTLVIPMFIHSLYNQFLNIIYANNNPSFNYLVVIGRFLSNNTSSNDILISNTFLFSKLVFIIAIVVILIWHIYLVYLFYHKKSL